MFFVISKVLGWLLMPSSIVTVLLGAGAFGTVTGRWPVASRRMLIWGVGLLLVCGLSPFGNILMLPLESRFERPVLPSDVAGIILLGGFESPGISHARGQLAVNEAAERLMEGVVLAHRLPSTRVIFTGGDGTLVRDGTSASERVGAFLRSVGIAEGRIVLEGRSRTTYENALFLREMLAPKASERYILVTSAFHMPRSVGTFRQQGFNVVPWPVDYRTRGLVDVLDPFGNIDDGLQRVSVGMREWLGLVAYRLSGRSTAFWPGPVAL